MGTLLLDLRHGLRILVKNPGFTAVAVVTLALGIGANTAIFSVVNGVLLRPLPYKDAGRLVNIWDVQPQLDQAPASYPEYLDWRRQTQIFEEVAAVFMTSETLIGSGEPRIVTAYRVSASLLPMLGVVPAQGRGFTHEEEARGGPPVVIVSHGFWQRQLGGDPAVLGRSLTLSARPRTIVGVLPEGFTFRLDRDVWEPLSLDETVAPRGNHFMQILGRMRPGMDLAQARRDLEAAAARLREDGSTTHGITLVPAQEQLVGDTRPALLIFLGAVALVLLIACTNVANLLLARATSRQKEVAIRLAVGASRARLIRQLLTESVLLAAMGGGVGLLLAAWGLDAAGAAMAGRVPRVEEIAIDGRVLAFTLGLSLLTGVLFGVAPAFQASAADVSETLKETGRLPGGGARGRRLGNLLVVAEVALSLVLLISAGLLIRSFLVVMHVNKGFDPRQVLAMEILLPTTGYAEPAHRAEFTRQLLAKVSSLPGVDGAAVVSHLPLGGDSTNGEFLIEGKSWPQGEEPLSDFRLASPDYFRVLRIPLIRGRFFDERDIEGSPAVALINESMARKFFPGEDPIGRRIDAQWGTSGWQEIVGVVGDIRHEALDRPALPEIYLPMLQRPAYGMTLVARAAVPPDGLTAALREQVYAVDRDQPVTWVRMMDQVVSESVNGRRLSMTLFGGFAGLAMFLAAVGLYGVLSYSVSQRTHEIGVRMALGASPSEVLRGVVGHGLRLTLAGVGLGLAGALALTRLLSGLLYGVGAADPVTYLAIPILLAAVAMFASWIPARRATKVDPMVALRYE